MAFHDLIAPYQSPMNSWSSDVLWDGPPCLSAPRASHSRAGGSGEGKCLVGGTKRTFAGTTCGMWEEGWLTRVAFIGLGTMGLPMARNLVTAGFEVVGYNRTQARGQALVEAGGRAASSVAAAVAGADVIATMLPDSPDVFAVLAGETGVFVAAEPGALVVDFSTIRPDVWIQLAEQGRHHGLRMLDAPVSGGEPGAVEGTLSIMVGGTSEDFEAALPILEAVGRTLVHIGSAGSGQIVKAANQLIVAGTIELVAEAIVLLEAYGVNITSALRVLGGGLAGSAVIEQKGQRMAASPPWCRYWVQLWLGHAGHYASKEAVRPHNSSTSLSMAE